MPADLSRSSHPNTVPRARTACSIAAGVLAALLATGSAGLSAAHDWVSPRDAAPAARRERPMQPPLQTPAEPASWPGMVWAGPSSGAPAAPNARDCQRTPPTEELAGIETVQRPSRRGRADDGVAASPHAALRAKAGTDAASLHEPGHGSAADTRTVNRAAAPPSPAGIAAKNAAEPAAEVGAAGRRALVRPEASPPVADDGPDGSPPVSAGEGPRTPPVSAGEGPRTPPVSAGEGPRTPPVSAGVVDDNADFGSYLGYRQRNAHLPVRARDVSERHLLTVHDSAGKPVPDAEVTLHAAGRTLPLWARTDAGGQVWLHPAAVADRGLALPAGLSTQAGAPGIAELPALIEVQVRRGSATGRAFLKRGQRDGLQVRLDRAVPIERARLDLVFLVDATGSMADEIDKLKRSMRQMADQIAQLPSQPDICFALVAYRDRGDAYFVRATDFGADLSGFQRSLAAVQAGGGGDTPEALNEALHTAVHRLSWRGDGATRLVVLVADAPPHLDYGRPTYDEDMQAALARGIKLFAVGASGLDPTGEYVFRQAAQYTGGRFVFLTYADARRPSSGPGRETLHEVQNYSVESLDKLVVRLVREELARRPTS